MERLPPSLVEVINSSGTKHRVDCFPGGTMVNTATRSATDRMHSWNRIVCVSFVSFRARTCSSIRVTGACGSQREPRRFGEKRRPRYSKIREIIYVDYVPTNTHAHTHLSNAPYARWRSGALTQKPSIATARDCRTACGGGGRHTVGTMTLKKYGTFCW